MSVYKAWSTAAENRDAEAMIACLHDDYTFVRHQSGTTMNKSEMAEMLRGFLSNPAPCGSRHRTWLDSCCHSSPTANWTAHAF